jgi:ribonuclease P protein component
MPKFTWVVRDFSLQLVDDEEQEISSNAYLERALSENVSVSKTNKDAEAKNEIRRHLKQFFPERECCCLIRPIVKEEYLQNLNQMAIEEMRPDFVKKTI